MYKNKYNKYLNKLKKRCMLLNNTNISNSNNTNEIYKCLLDEMELLHDLSENGDLILYDNDKKDNILRKKMLHLDDHSPFNFWI
jgi:hypothetical protein